MIIDVHCVALIFQSRTESMEASEISRPKGRRIGANELSRVFQVAKPGGASEWELFLFRGEDVED